MPFPVLVVERVELYEAITRTRLVTTYSYHHGHYDGEEREFRGFGRVDQQDTESVADGFGQGLFTDKPTPLNGECPRPPVLTKTWFHTGAYLGRAKLEERYRAEYYSPSPSGPDPRLLADTLLPEGLSLAERKQACRALKGATLRSEVFALDDTDKEPHAYTVTEQSYSIRRVQPETPGAGEGMFSAVFFVHARESVQSVYERNPQDPRVSHQITLAVDAYGQVTKAITLAYGRTGGPGWLPEQQKPWAALAENDLVHLAGSLAGYRLGIPMESRIFEVTGLAAPTNGSLYTPGEMTSALASIGQPGSAVDKRLLGRVAHRYYDAASLGGTPAPLPAGQTDLLALPYDPPG